MSVEEGGSVGLLVGEADCGSGTAPVKGSH